MKKILILAILSVFILSNNVSAKEKITWQVVNWPPFQILKGSEKGKGLYDALLNLYIKNLPQYEHETKEMNWARFWTDVQKGEQVCNIFAIKTDARLKIARFSQPTWFGLPQRIIMNKNTIKKMGSPVEISLNEMIKNKKYKGVIESKRSYGVNLDKILRNNNKNSNVEKISAGPESIIQMVLSGRADYTIEYPIVASYLANQVGAKYKAKIGSVGIKETPKFIVAWVACPKSKWGDIVTGDINKVLNRVKLTPEYLEIMKMWYSDPKELSTIENNYSKFFLKIK